MALSTTRLLFIVIHQVYELWFKELLHEFDRVRRLLEADEPHRAQHTLKRILTILKVMVAQLDILETMTPLEFLCFRERLEAASGFQSNQFRQIEFLLGPRSRRRRSSGFRQAAARRRRSERRYRGADVVGRLPALPGARRLRDAASQLARDVHGAAWRRRPRSQRDSHRESTGAT